MLPPGVWWRLYDRPITVFGGGPESDVPASRSETSSMPTIFEHAGVERSARSARGAKGARANGRIRTSP